MNKEKTKEERARILLGRRIKRAREKKGLTQKQLAKLLDIKQPRISFWEKGKENPSFGKMVKLKEVLNIRCM